MNKKLAIMLALIGCVTGKQSIAQGVSVNTTGADPDPSAVLDVSSTTQGMLVPRMSSIQRGLIANPQTGLLVYQIDAPAGFYFYNGSSWTSLNAYTTVPLANGGTSADLSATGGVGQYLKQSSAGAPISVGTIPFSDITGTDLTGPIISTGNVTSVASQTGTGSTFVMSASPDLTGVPTAPTAIAGTNTTQIATTAFVTGALSAVGSRWDQLTSPTGNMAITQPAANTSAFTFSNATNDAMTMTSSTTSTGKMLVVKNTGTALTTGSALDVNTSGALTGFTGNLANISMSGASAAGNSGSLLNISDAGAANTTKLLTMSSSSTTNTNSLLSMTSASAGAFANGGVRFNFTGAHTNSGLQVDDATQTGNAVRINATALTTGSALNITSTANTPTGNSVSGVSIAPTYNQAGTAAATDLKINRTETAVGTGNQFLIDAQVGGTSKFSVTNKGNVSGNNFIEGYQTSATASTVLTFTSPRLLYLTGGATTQTVQLPGTSTIAGQKFIIANNNVASAQSATVCASGGTTAPFQIAILPPGAAAEFMCVSAGGTTAASWLATEYGGSLFRIQTLTSGTTTYTPSPGTIAIYAILVGPGGGGGGANCSAGYYSCAGGGGAGAVCYKWLTGLVPGTAYTTNIPTGGAGANAGSNNGNAAASGTTLLVNGVTYTAGSGQGGLFSNNNNIYQGFAVRGGDGGTASNGDVNASGMNGYIGVGSTTNNTGYSGAGGSTPFGAGANGVINNGNAGVAATGYGGGGSGGACTGSTNRAGGAGGPGAIIIYEYH